ncbi:MAG: hypothetical protein EOO06_09410 [Chitinophagaceae bacterium]|nr:MAG: hypothetical protein EOO06_09410 [Chitinophagaceae bacterium]
MKALLNFLVLFLGFASSCFGQTPKSGFRQKIVKTDTIHLKQYLRAKYNSPKHDCGCISALRYDVFKLKKDFYSEMLFARDINKENYKDLKQNIDADIEIFGVPIGASGENIEKIKQIYNEKIRLHNVNKELLEYERYTTSDISYNTYKACMEMCLKSQSKGLDAYLVHEDEEAVDIDIVYRGEARAAPLEVTYFADGKNETLEVGTGEYSTIHLPRKTRKAFSLVFSCAQYASLPVEIKAFKPITLSYSVTYDYDKEDVETISYSLRTGDNWDKGCDLKRRVNYDWDEKKIRSWLQSLGNGGFTEDETDCAKDKSAQATRYAFKIAAPEGYHLRNKAVHCTGQGCAYSEYNYYYDDGPTLITYSGRTFGSPADVSFSVEMFKTTVLNEVYQGNSFSRELTFYIPTKSRKAIIHYGDGLLAVGQSNSDIKFISQSETSDGVTIYYYYIQKTLADRDADRK